MSGIIADNVGRASGLVKASGGGGILQVKTTYYTVQHDVSSDTFAVFHTNYAVTITPTASNSSFWLDANVSLGSSNQDHASSLSFFDSQVGTSGGNELFAETTASSGSRELGAFAGLRGFAAVSNGHNHALYGVHIGGLYTPASNNGSARTFYVCTKKTNGSFSSQLNYAKGDGVYSFSGTSNISVMEVSGSII